MNIRNRVAITFILYIAVNKITAQDIKSLFELGRYPRQVLGNLNHNQEYPQFPGEYEISLNPYHLVMKQLCNGSVSGQIDILNF